MVKGMPKTAHEDKPINSKIRSDADAESDVKSSEDNWPQVCEAVAKGEKMSSMLETDEGKVSVVTGNVEASTGSSFYEPRTKSVAFGRPLSENEPSKLLPQVCLVLLEEFNVMQRRLMTIKQEVWHLCSEANITGHDQQMQLRLLLDEGHLVLDNGKYNYDVINSRRDYSKVLCLRAKGRLDEFSKLFDSIVAFVNASKESWPKHQSFGEARLANNNVPVVDDYFDRASEAYEIAKPWLWPVGLPAVVKLMMFLMSIALTQCLVVIVLVTS